MPFVPDQQTPPAAPRGRFVPDSAPAAAPSEPAPTTSRNPLKWLLGLGETALSMGTGMVSTPINETLAGFAEADFGSDRPVGDTAARILADPPVGTYSPRTAEGRAITEKLGAFMAPVAEAIRTGTDTDNPDPRVRATGHFLNATFGFLPLKAPIARRMGRPRAPTIPELKTASQAAYAAAERGSGIVAQNSLANFTNRAEQMLAHEGVDKTLHPKTMAGLERLMQESTQPGIAGHSLKGIEVQRRVLAAAENAAERGSDDARLAGKLLDDFDDYVDNLSPADLVGGVGDAAATAKNYATARELWSRMRKAETIEALVERAKNSAPSLTQSGLENALRLEFKSLANNPKRFNRFSPEERAAITRVVRGSIPQNLARYGGKLAVRGPISGGLSIGGGMAIAGPAGAAALAGVGEASALAARLMRMGDVNRVRELVRIGKAPPSRIPGSQSLPQLGSIPAYALASQPPEQR